MAFSIGEAQSSSVSNTKYIGYGTFKIVAINPTKEEYEKLFNRQVQEWKGYNGALQDGTPYVRVVFVLKDVREGSEMPLIQTSYCLIRRPRKTQDGRTQVIDAYGNTAWVTDEQFANQEVPLSKSGRPLSIIPPYQMTCTGQDRLIDFLKAWLYTPNSHKWDDVAQSFVVKPAEELNKCCIGLDHMKDYWTGDVSEIKNILDTAAISEHTIKAMLTVRENEFNGRQTWVQNVYDGRVVPGFGKYDWIEREFQKDLQQGRHQNERYVFQDAIPFIPQPMQPQQQFTSFVPQQQPQAPAYNGPAYAAPAAVMNYATQPTAQPAPDLSGDPNELPF